MPFGYNGKILRVDLSSRTVQVDEPALDVYRRYMGGSLLASYYLLTEMPGGVDPLGPDNVLVVACSVVTGAPAFGASRYTIAAKSPLTGAFGEAEAGGWFGPQLKHAGFDAIIIKGQSDAPVYLWIHDGEAELRDASAIWGKTSGEAQAAIHAELGDDKIVIAQTGPAGEKLVRFANVINDLKHANGRTGMGAVMGSKKLRAIAVRGTRKPDIADPEGLKAAQKTVRDNYKRQPGDLHDFGTPRLINILNGSGMLPTQNFRFGTFDGADDISGERLTEKYLVGRGSCFMCPVACKREVKVDGRYQVDPMYGGPEYETVAALGSFCRVSDLEAVCKAHEICNAHCIDTISAGVAVAFAMECYENGILTREDAGGLDLTWGNAEAMVQLVEQIALRQGLGDLLAEGTKIAAKRLDRGAEQYAMEVKGQEIPMHEARGKKGMAFSYACSPTGADHVESPHDPFFAACDPEGTHSAAPMGLIEPVDPLELTPAKVRIFCNGQRIWSLYNTIGMCNFVAAPLGPYGLIPITNMVRAVTGWNTSLLELMNAAQRTVLLPLVFNKREGFTREDDTLPERLFGALPDGPLAGQRIDREEFEPMRALYYQMIGCDPETGHPTLAKLAELGIEWAAEI